MFKPNQNLGISGKAVLKYTLLPQISPRLKEIIGSGFANLSFFMVLVYQAVKLLPNDHPYLKSGARGTYSIRDVLGEASKNLQFNMKHIDQVIIYFALILGIILLGIQFFLLLISFLINPAMAGPAMPTGYGQFFTTAAPSEDIAFRLLDSVFGIPSLFGSKEVTENAFHTALHGLFQFYSIGLLVIAAILVIYMIFAVLAETAQTGTPFGKRYNHTWAPIRLVVAIGLLVPISYGLNSGQWITLYAAKMGSGFATNGWNKFNEVLGADNPLSNDSLIATPNMPDLKDISAFMMMAHACKAAYQEKNYMVGTEDVGDEIKAYLIDRDDPDSSQLMTGDIIAALKYTNNKDIFIRFGHKNNIYTNFAGNIFPYCGDIKVINTEKPERIAGGRAGAAGRPGSQLVLTPTGILAGSYYVLVNQMWGTQSQVSTPIGNVNINVPQGAAFTQMAVDAEKFINNELTNNPKMDLTPDLQNLIKTEAENQIEQGIVQAVLILRGQQQDKDQYLKYGWGGAGIFYNKIAAVNGQLTNAVFNKPGIVTYPYVMQEVCKENKQGNENVEAKKCYDPLLRKGQPVTLPQKSDEDIAKALSKVHDYWYKDNENDSGNAIINVINVMLGTSGLFDMCKNTDVHPLGQLSALGKGLIEAAIRNIGIGLGLGIASIIPVVGPTAGALSGMAMTFASIGILIGFMLYYLVPFMPFLYFFFAVGGWVKGIFEAMVGVPLWALSHIRIDGQGLPGDGGINGYFLIFEIFIRPILIVFGLIASVIIFGAMIKVLNEIFGIVVNNLAGNDPTLGEACFQGSPNPDKQAEMAQTFRGPIDEFFYTIVYAILVYMIGMSSFKLIDLIPNNILRWMGQGIQTYNDVAGEPAEGLMQKMAIGGGVLGGQLQQAGSQGMGAIKSAGQGLMDMTNDKP